MFYSAKDYSASDLTQYVRLYVEDGVLKVCCGHYIKTVPVAQMYFCRLIFCLFLSWVMPV